MSALVEKIVKVLVLLLACGGLYLLATYEHRVRETIRHAEVALTPACIEKLARYGLESGERYQSPYVLRRTGAKVVTHGYSDDDVRAIQRGCNIIDDTQGRLASNPDRERWNTRRFIRGTQTA